MVTPASSSLLAAQIYGSTAQRGGGRVGAPARPVQAENTAQEVRESARSRQSARDFPVDRVELSTRAEAPQRAEPAPRISEEPPQDASFEEDARAFAREAPGTSKTRFEAPGSRLDIRV